MKGPIFEKLKRKDCEYSSNRKITKPTISSELLPDLKTTDNSPIATFEAQTFGRKSLNSKISSRFTKTIITSKDLQNEYSNCRALNLKTEDGKFRSFQNKSSSKSIEEIHDETVNQLNSPARIQKVKVYYVIPETFYSEMDLAALKFTADTESKKSVKDPSITLKHGFVIQHVFVNIKGDRLVAELLSNSLFKINDYLNSHAFSYRLKSDTSCFSFRSSKKTGLPDFDLPVVYDKAKIGDLYMKKLTLCYGCLEEDMKNRPTELLEKECVSKTPKVIPKCKCIVF